MPKVLFICSAILCGAALVAHAQQTAPSTANDFALRLSGNVTAQGIPEVYMWGAGMPRDGVEGAGFPILKNAQHSAIFQEAVAAGGYNHHSQLACYKGVFYAAWSNHPKGEDAAGQRILFATSSDGVTWRPWTEAFPPPDKVGAWDDGFGYYSVAGPWRIYENEIYLTARLYKFVGWEDASGKDLVYKRDSVHYFKRFESVGLLARKMTGGTLGPVFALSTRMNRISDLAYPFLPYGDPAWQAAANAIGQTFEIQREPIPTAVDGARMVEPTVYQTSANIKIAIVRDDKFSHRKYVSFSKDDGRTWSTALPTNIPDSPSLDISLKAPGGAILLIGNHCASRFDDGAKRRHYGRDTLDVAISTDGYLFAKTFAIRTGAHQWRVPREEVPGRGGGPQYPSALIEKDRLYVMYSLGKEDIWCTSIPLADILPAPSNPSIQPTSLP